MRKCNSINKGQLILLLGSILGIIGGIIMMIYGLYCIFWWVGFESEFIAIGQTYASIGIKIVTKYTAMTLTTVIGIVVIMDIVGIFIGKINKVIGGIILFGVGAFTIIGSFIPIEAAYVVTIGLEDISLPVTPLCYNYLPFWIDPILMIIGGILIYKSKD